MEISISPDRIQFGSNLTINFYRTIRIPDDGKDYPLPPGLGNFPVKSITDYISKVPESWRSEAGAFIPMYQREALWISFTTLRRWEPCAVKIGIGKVNAISGEKWCEELRPDEEDYIVTPPQPWLDGINSGDGVIRQFVAMPLGMGYTVEGQVTGEEKFGGIQIVVYPPHEGRFNEPEYNATVESDILCGGEFPGDEPPMVGGAPGATGGSEMGLAAGGKMKQKIYPDPHGIECWDSDNSGSLNLHIVNSLMYREITGEEPPPTPITAKTYKNHGYPWFALYDENHGDRAASKILKKIKSVKEMDIFKGFSSQQDDDSIDIPPENIKTYDMDKEK